MIGALAGDIIGSVYEHQPIKTTDFPLFQAASRFTDDSVLSVAVASAILDGTPYAEAVRELGRRYPNAGYGGSFIQWLAADDAGPYHSWGNGAAMRVSPVGFAFQDEADVLAQAKATADITHNHPEGIKGAQATALAVFMARTGADKTTIRDTLTEQFDYDLTRTLDDIRPHYSFDVSCQGSVQEAIIAFLESDSYEDAVRKAVSLGGDSDTQACIAGGIADAFYGVPETIQTEVKQRLTADLRAITDAFCQRYR
ncbi:ADP-ribosylglycohydrolase family protein [Halomonas sp. SH5A2]|uniref:ADP-ribosylglycohydrolase family protein n=1 Tax=Halomonas sp. SH5A2 TaxID=2749040 RepID=UPI00163F2A07|nr:ADP-ribosylglycohydrolase family protein [Halomonas sp. SH5A2]QNI02255.1 ADP-ribosylglycohydrolase family protein [Halomonas sp. SH5A2]